MEVVGVAQLGVVAAAVELAAAAVVVDDVVAVVVVELVDDAYTFAYVLVDVQQKEVFENVLAYLVDYVQGAFADNILVEVPLVIADVVAYVVQQIDAVVVVDHMVAFVVGVVDVSYLVDYFVASFVVVVAVVGIVDVAVVSLDLYSLE
uniref:Uncharacterized protein n=1 Tax=Panagrolaimus sp. ES5 TaxID=591445 RepID=A0AC34GGZ9_9BILA